MSSMMKNILAYADLFLGYLTSVLMRVLLYGLTAIFTLAAILVVLIGPFEGRFDLNELDNLELVVQIVFVLITVRFFKRSKSEGIAFWPCLKSYCFISTFLSILFLAAIALAFLMLLKQEGEIGRSDLYRLPDFKYFLFSGLYLLVLHAFTPLPKLNLIKKTVKKQDSENNDSDWLESDHANFFADSAGNTRTNSMDSGNS
ncbi:hypothetical protein [Marinomonas communis]|uniref:Uncharacterized protein n=1 Tax=Marinomonas communis TaxID=28254 RepID=A0A4R6XE42_9GAMM|nr:hypothetical protein [Marinomonas communis]TDR15507.1 hypothetical protein C8D85_0873 [Marinomonas communis]